MQSFNNSVEFIELLTEALNDGFCQQIPVAVMLFALAVFLGVWKGPSVDQQIVFFA